MKTSIRHAHRALLTQCTCSVHDQPTAGQTHTLQHTDASTPSAWCTKGTAGPSDMGTHRRTHTQSSWLNDGAAAATASELT
jgi:hypothetical protein